MNHPLAPLAIALAALATSATSLLADPLVMGPVPLSGGTFTAFDASNSVNQLASQGTSTFINPPLQWDENVLTSGFAQQSTTNTFANGSWAQATYTNFSSFTTSATTTTISSSIYNNRILQPAVPDTVSAYAGASLFYNFTITATSSVTMSWNTHFSGPAPDNVVMFWDIAGTNPALGSVAGTSGIDSGLWTGTLAPGEYSMIYTRHDGNTSSANLTATTFSTFTLTATIPTPTTATLLALAALPSTKRRRP